jgi:Armadillo/beta-catenin-like repeat
MGNLCLGLEPISPSTWECLICNRLSKSSEKERARAGVPVFEAVQEEECVVSIGKSSRESPPFSSVLENHYQSKIHRRCVEAFLLLDHRDEVRFKLTFWLDPFIACLPRSEQREEIKELVRNYRERGTDSDSRESFANALMLLQTHMQREVEESIYEQFSVLVAQTPFAAFDESETNIVLDNRRSFGGDHLNLVVSLVLEYLPEFARPAFMAPTAKSIAERNFSNLAKRVMTDDSSQSPLVAQIDQIIGCGAVPYLSDFLGSGSNPILQREAAWALSRLASGIPEHIKAIVDAGTVPVFVKLMSCSNEALRGPAVRALGSIADNSEDYRDLVVRAGALQQLLLQLPGCSDQSILRSAKWSAKALRRDHRFSSKLARSTMTALASLVSSADEEVLMNTCMALSYLVKCSGAASQAVVDSSACSHLVELLLHPSQEVQSVVLDALRFISAGSDRQAQIIVDNNGLPSLLGLLFSSDQSIRRNACGNIANVAGGNEVQVQAVIDNNLVPVLIQLLSDADDTIRSEAARAIYNLYTKEGG